MLLKRTNGKDYSVKNLNELFCSEEAAKANIKESERQLENLKALESELKRLIAEEKAKKLLEDVKQMSDADAQALFEQLKVKLGQQ